MAIFQKVPNWGEIRPFLCPKGIKKYISFYAKIFTNYLGYVFVPTNPDHIWVKHTPNSLCFTCKKFGVKNGRILPLLDIIWKMVILPHELCPGRFTGSISQPIRSCPDCQNLSELKTLLNQASSISTSRRSPFSSSTSSLNACKDMHKRVNLRSTFKKVIFS